MNKFRSSVILILFIAFTGTACAPKKQPAGETGPREPALRVSRSFPFVNPSILEPRKIRTHSVADLQTQLKSIFPDDPQFRHAFWGVLVRSVDRGDVLYAHNNEKLMIPASAQKIVTAVAALHHLGPVYSFETRLATDGSISGDALRGNLIVIGSGDPSISGQFYADEGKQAFVDWANKLKSIGIRRITGDVIAIQDDAVKLGDGWPWDGLSYPYSAEVGSLIFNENTITAVVSGGRVGRTVTLKMVPDNHFFHVTNRGTTTSSGGINIGWEKDPFRNELTITGTLGRGQQDYGSFAVNESEAYFAHVLKETLEENGINVQGTSLATKKKRDAVDLYVHRSPALETLAAIMLKESNNLYAESFLKAVGRSAKNHPTFDMGKKAVSEMLELFGVPSGSYFIADGSGLSRYNNISPDLLVSVLTAAARNNYFESFYNSLSIAGYDGTLRNRMKFTAAERNVHAKTGTLNSVRSLAGYVTTREGELLAFCFIANNFVISRQKAESTQDFALELLANFSRK